MFFNRNDNEDNRIIISFMDSSSSRSHRKTGSIIGPAFKIIKIVLLFLACLFLYHRLPYFISSITYALKNFFSF